jgi:hypothetical protein
MSSKYRNSPTIVDGVRYASKAEARRGAELALLQRAGKIGDLVRQPRFPLKVNGQLVCTYVADFTYRLNAGETVVEDVKGVETEAFKIKRKLLRALQGVEIVLVRA